MEAGQDLLPPGELDGQLIIPSLVMVLFEPTAGKGQPVYWGLFDEQDQVMNLTVSSDEPLQYTFTSEGVRNLTVKGYSEAEGWVPAKDILTFKVLNKIEELMITDFNRITPTNNSKMFSASFKVFHPLLCFVIDFNDGSPQEAYGQNSLCQNNFPDATYQDSSVSNPFSFSHMYLEESLYNVSVVVKDLLTTLRSRLQVVVAYLPCEAPVVDIVDKISVPYAAHEFKRSMPFIHSTESTIDCNVTVGTRRSWTITQVEEEEGLPIADIPVEGILNSWNFSQLSVPALFLHYGTYRLTYQLELLASKMFPLARSAFTYIKIVKSSLQAVLVKGAMSKVSRGFGELLELDPQQYSQDPDWPEDKSFTYIWFCRRIDTDPEHPTPYKAYNNHTIPVPLSQKDSPGGGCFGRGPGTLDYNNGKLELDTASFTHMTATYEVLLVLQKDTRSAVAKLLVEVSEKAPPVITIECADKKLCQPTFAGLQVNPSNRIALRSLCSSDCYNNMNYSWSITSGAGAAVVEEGSNERCLLASSEENSLAPDPWPELVPTGKTSKDIAISSEFFMCNPDEAFKLTLTVTAPYGIKGEYVMTLVLNKPPENGSCSIISFAKTFSLVNETIIKCTNWIDPEGAGVAQYTFFMYKATNREPVKEIIISTIKAEAVVVLPVGNFTLFCDVMDVFGASRKALVGDIEVELPTKEQLDNFQVNKRLQHIASTGDQALLSMMLKAQSSVRDNADWYSLNMDIISNLTSEEIDDRLRDLAKMNTETLNTAISTMIFGTINQLNVGAGVLEEALKGISASEQGSKTVDMEARETALKLVEAMTNELEAISVPSPQDLVPFLSASLGALSDIMTGVHGIIDGKNITNVPPTDIDAASNWDYDTGVDDVGVQIPLDRKTMLEKNVLETTRMKAKEQVTQMMGIVKKIVKVVDSKTVEGEMIFTESSNNATIMVAKMAEEIFLNNGRTIELSQDGGKIEVPVGFCPSKQKGHKGCKDAISLAFVQWPGITHSYVPTSKELSKNTRIVDMDVYLEGELVNVTSLENGIIINIPRSPEELPEAVVVTEEEARAAMNHIPFVYNQFTVARSGAAVSIEISASGSSAPLLVMLISHEYLPTPSKYELVYHVATIPLNELGVHDLFLNGMVIKNRTGRFYLAVAALKKASDIGSLGDNSSTLTSEMFE